MTYLLPIIAIAFSVSALVLAIVNARRNKQLQSQLLSQDVVQQKANQRRDELDEIVQRLDTQSQASVELIQKQLQHLELQQQSIRKATDHLCQESQNLAVLPTWHPIRVSLTNELRPRLAPITDQLCPVLFPNQIAMGEYDWMYRLQDLKFPYSLTFEEGMLIHYLIVANDLKSGYEIATAFGFSSFFIGLALEKTGGYLVSADAYIEEAKEDFLYDHDVTREHVQRLQQLVQGQQPGQLPRGLQFAIEGARILNIEERVDYRIACSPEGVPNLLRDRKLDFAFIDGGHFGEQPVLDVESVLPFLQPDRFMMVFHDTQCEAVAKAVHFAAESTGAEPFSIHTRNRIVVVANGFDKKTLQTCRAMTFRQST